MKEKLKGIVLGIILGTMLVPTVFATIGTVTKELSYNDIKITLNDQKLTPTDANGNYVEPFIIDGTTYLPVRGVASALGLDVSWDGATQTVFIQDANQIKLAAAYLLGTSSWLTEISLMLSECQTILYYEPRDSDAYNSNYMIFKMIRDTYNEKKSEYVAVSNAIVNNNTSTEYVEIANKILNMIASLDENIGLLSDLYVSYDYTKNARYDENEVNISITGGEIRQMIYDYMYNYPMKKWCHLNHSALLNKNPVER